MRTILAAGALALLLSACNQAETKSDAAAPPPAAEPAAAEPAAAPASMEKVQFSGCPAKGVEAGCMIVESGGVTYNITAAKPPVEMRGLGIDGEGVPSSDMSICQQGTVLKDITYTYNKMKCPMDDAAK